MAFSDLLKQSTILCPSCHASFELGPDLKSITESAGTLLDKLTGLLGDNPHGELCEEIAEHYDVHPDQAVEMLREALNDEEIRDRIFDFLSDNGE